MTRSAAPDPWHPPAPWAWAWSGLVAGALLALVLFAPARWLASAVAWASEGRVLLAGARGTVWNGSAQWVLAGGRGSRDAVALPSRLVWRLRPGWQGLRLSVRAACCTPEPVQITWQPRWGGWSIAIADTAASDWPASLLAGLGTPWNTLRLEGRLQVTTRGFALRRQGPDVQVQGRVELLALDMASSLTTLRPMGSYRLALEGGTVPTLRLTTLEGGLQLSGSGHWQGAHLRFAGEARTAPGREAVLAHLLNLIGRREGARSVITLG